MVTETFYDFAGRAWKKNNARWDATATAGQQLLMPLDADVKSQNVTRFDAAGRVTDEILLPAGCRAMAHYDPSITGSTPPCCRRRARRRCSDFFDEFGRAVELRQFHGAQATGEL